MSVETWRAIPSCPGFSASTEGRIRNDNTGRVLKGSRDRLGYVQVRTGPHNGRSHVLRYAHRLVLEAHVGPCPEGMEACHGDGRRDHNALRNLRWDTRAANLADMERHGTRACGARIHRTKLTADDVVLAFHMKRAGHTPKEIAFVLDVTPGTVHAVLTRRTWRHVEIPCP